MRTGDLQSNAVTLFDLLRSIHYPLTEEEKKDISAGYTPVYLQILHFVFFNFSKYFRQFLIEKQHYLYYSSDYNFARGVFNVLRKEFNIRPTLNLEQFLTAGAFIEHRIMICKDAIKIARRVHNQRLRAHRQETLKYGCATQDRTASQRSLSNPSESFRSNSQRSDSNKQIKSADAIFHSQELSPEANTLAEYGFAEKNGNDTYKTSSTTEIKDSKKIVHSSSTERGKAEAASVEVDWANEKDSAVFTNMQSKDETFLIKKLQCSVEKFASFQVRFNKTSSQLAALIEKIHDDVSSIDERVKRIEEYLKLDASPPNGQIGTGEAVAKLSLLPKVVQSTSSKECQEAVDEKGGFNAQKTIEKPGPEPSLKQSGKSCDSATADATSDRLSGTSESCARPDTHKNVPYNQSNKKNSEIPKEILEENNELDNQLRSSVAKISEKILLIQNAFSKAHIKNCSMHSNAANTPSPHFISNVEPHTANVKTDANVAKNMLIDSSNFLTAASQGKSFQAPLNALPSISVTSSSFSPVYPIVPEKLNRYSRTEMLQSKDFQYTSFAETSQADNLKSASEIKLVLNREKHLSAKSQSDSISVSTDRSYNWWGKTPAFGLDESSESE